MKERIENIVKQIVEDFYNIGENAIKLATVNACCNSLIKEDKQNEH